VHRQAEQFTADAFGDGTASGAIGIRCHQVNGPGVQDAREDISLGEVTLQRVTL
jgi:hypothetical protein